jgi:hypothetical protein
LKASLISVVVVIVTVLPSADKASCAVASFEDKDTG